VEECKSKLFRLGIKLGVSPRLIATRLLSQEDKDDMLKGLISDEALEAHVKVWMEFGMCDYANGLYIPYRPSSELPMGRYRGRVDRVTIDSKSV